MNDKDFFTSVEWFVNRDSHTEGVRVAFFVTGIGWVFIIEILIHAFVTSFTSSCYKCFFVVYFVIGVEALSNLEVLDVSTNCITSFHTITSLLRLNFLVSVSNMLALAYTETLS